MGRSMDVVQVLGDVLDLLHSSTTTSGAAAAGGTDLTSLRTPRYGERAENERGSAPRAGRIVRRRAGLARRRAGGPAEAAARAGRRAGQRVRDHAPGGVTQVTVDMTETDAPAEGRPRRPRRQRTRRRAKTRKAYQWVSVDVVLPPGSAPRRLARRLARTRRWRHGCGLRRARKTAARKPASKGRPCGRRRERAATTANELPACSANPCTAPRGTRHAARWSGGQRRGRRGRARGGSCVLRRCGRDRRPCGPCVRARGRRAGPARRAHARRAARRRDSRPPRPELNPERERRHGHRHPRPGADSPDGQPAGARAGRGRGPGGRGPVEQPVRLAHPGQPRRDDKIEAAVAAAIPHGHREPGKYPRRGGRGGRGTARRAASSDAAPREHA